MRPQTMEEERMVSNDPADARKRNISPGMTSQSSRMQVDKKLAEMGNLESASELARASMKATRQERLDPNNPSSR